MTKCKICGLSDSIRSAIESRVAAGIPYRKIALLVNSANPEANVTKDNISNHKRHFEAQALEKDIHAGLDYVKIFEEADKRPPPDIVGTVDRELNRFAEIDKHRRLTTEENQRKIKYLEIKLRCYEAQLQSTHYTDIEWEKEADAEIARVRELLESKPTEVVIE